jgi:uncharacterized membrane protein YfcA
MTDAYQVWLALAALFAGAIASVTGFGIGSILTPLVSVAVGMKVAVAMVAIPHLLATALRFWLLREHVDRLVLLHFGALSAIGGVAGALLHSFANSPILSAVFAMLLIFAGVSELTGKSDEMRFGGRTAWFAGALSGLLGGLVGNQGGIRSAALLGFNVKRHTFVATATAIGLIVDAARMPVYLASQLHDLLAMWPTILILIVGVVVGTMIGEKVLRSIPDHWFRHIISLCLLALGGFMIYRTFQYGGH